MIFKNVIPVSKVKKDLSGILQDMTIQGEMVTITRKGKAVGVIMTPEHYESLSETIEIMADKEILSVLITSQEEFKSGKVFTDEEVWQDK